MNGTALRVVGEPYSAVQIPIYLSPRNHFPGSQNSVT